MEGGRELVVCGRGKGGTCNGRGGTHCGRSISLGNAKSVWHSVKHTHQNETPPPPPSRAPPQATQAASAAGCNCYSCYRSCFCCSSWPAALVEHFLSVCFCFVFLLSFLFFFARSQTRSTESLTAKWVHCGIFYLPPSLSLPLSSSLSVCVLHLCFPLAAYYSVLPPKLNANNARRRKSCRCHSAHCATLCYTTLHTQCVLVPGERISHCPR